MAKKAKKLTFEQRKKLVLTPCKTKKELGNWIKYHLGVYLPDCTVSRYADTNPFDAVWEAYDICVNNNNPDNIEELLEDYPSIKREDIYACLDYAASLAEEQITPIEMLENTV